MKAPDKIYITVIPSQIANGLVYTTCSDDCSNAEEYIRKDYLLKKIRKIAIWNTIKVGGKEIRDIVTKIIESI